MNSGHLDTPIYLYSLSQVRDKASSFTWVWKEYDCSDYIWAERVTAQVTQRQDSDQNRSERNERFRIREDDRFTAPDARDKLGLFDGCFYYRITGVQPDLKNDGYLLLTLSYVQNRPIIERVPNSGRVTE